MSIYHVPFATLAILSFFLFHFSEQFLVVGLAYHSVHLALGKRFLPWHSLTINNDEALLALHFIF
jgi:hypothetical protein